MAPSGPLRPLLLLALSCAVLILTVTPALAARSRALLGSFGSGSLSGVAVNQQTGNVYVADGSAGVIDVFGASGGSPTGEVPKEITGLGNAGAAEPEGVAVDNSCFYEKLSGAACEAFDHSNGDVYLANEKKSGGAVQKLALNGLSHEYEVVQEFRFKEVSGVAVDHRGDLYVADFYGGAKEEPKVIAELNSKGEEVGAIAQAAIAHPFYVAVGAPGVIYVGGYSKGGVAEIQVGSKDEVLSETLLQTGAEAVAVDQQGDALVDSERALSEYDSAGALIGTFGTFTGSFGVAVNDTSGEAYVSDRSAGVVDIFGPSGPLAEVVTGSATEPTGTSGRLNGTVNPEGVEVSDCHFDYVEEAGYAPTEPNPYAAGATAACAQTVGKGSGQVPVSANLTGLSPGTVYHFRLQATNANGTSFGGDATLSTIAPSITAASVTNLTATSADLTAKINPEDNATTYHFEYDTRAYAPGEPPHGTSLPESTISTGAVASVSQPISGLSANTTYHWRVVASSGVGTVTSPDQTFIDDTAGTALPDNRAYELVTPAHKNGALLNAFFLGGKAPQIAADGQHVIAASVQCFADPQTCKAIRAPDEGNPFEFSRTASGWVTHPLAAPASVETDSLRTVSADAGTALFSVPRVPPGVIEEEFSGWDEHGSFVNVGPLGEHANFGAVTGGKVHSTRDLSHVVYQPEEGKAVWSFNPTIAATLYEYVGTGNAEPLMVGVTGGFENGENHKPIGTCGTMLGGISQMSDSNGSLSGDGRTVYFTAVGHGHGDPCTEATSPPARELYARIDGELPDARSVLISGPTPTACSSTECHKNTTEEAAARDANFEAASADGSHAFFTDTQQLSDHASEDPNPLSSAAGLSCSVVVEAGGCNLYESVCLPPCGRQGEEPNASGRELIDVSEGPGGAPVPEGPRVQGVVGISGDGSHVYFVARGVLTGAEQNQSHETAEDERENLYVYERDEAHPEGRLAFIATLSPFDGLEWKQKVPGSGGGAANVTPTGRFLVFTSHRALTADATCVEGEGAAPACPQQVFEYDAQTHALVRVSVGEKGFNDNGNDGVLGTPLETGQQDLYSGDARVAEPGRGDGESDSVPVRLDPTMSDDGAFVFFQSPVALAPGALNDIPVGEEKELFAQNVYEYHEGHVSLISDGKDTTHEGKTLESAVAPLLGSDATGANVFFTTFDQLVPEDTDTQRDIYDAHICSEAEPCPQPRGPPAPCEGEACHGAPPAQGAGQTPGSESFAGPGNLTPPPPPKSSPKGKTAAQVRAEKLAKALKACHKKHGKKRAACERQARRAYGAKKASKSSRARRAGSARGARP